MRIIHKASLVFLLKDIYSKMPVTTAVILCNGKQNPYTRKKEGYYVFSNLYPGDYDVSISCKGYTSLNFSVILKENETKVMDFDMSYAVDNAGLTNLTRFEIRLLENGKPLVGTDVILKLKNEAEFLKIIEPSQAGSDEIKLNVDMLNGLMGQKYIYKFKRKEYEIFFFGYNQEKKCYILKDFLNEGLEPGGKFYPIWNLKSDYAGRVTMPLIIQFMADETIKFECKVPPDGPKAAVSFKMKGGHSSGKAFYADAKLKKTAGK